VRLVEVHPKDFITWNSPTISAMPLPAERGFVGGDLPGEADLAASDGIPPNVCGSTWFAEFLFLAGVHAISAACWRRRRPHRGHERRAELWLLAERYGAYVDSGAANHAARAPFTVVGVSPEAFNGLTVDTSPTFVFPAPWLARSPRWARAQHLTAQIFARLRPVSPSSAPATRPTSYCTRFTRNSSTGSFRRPGKRAGSQRHSTRLRWSRWSTEYRPCARNSAAGSKC